MDLPKVGRNDPCPCGSGKKYKNCHYGQEAKKTYTATGKRKFKAKVITMADKSAELFQHAPMVPSTLDLEKEKNVKLKPTERDYRVKQEESSGSIPVFETNQPIPEAKPFEPLHIPEGDFKPTSKDFREKNENE